MFALIVSYTVFIPYTGFLLMQVFRICAAVSNNRVCDTSRLKFGLFSPNVSVEPNQTTSRTSVSDQLKGSVGSALNTEPVFGLRYCSESRCEDSKHGNSLIREITRAPPGKTSSRFIFFPYKGLPVRVFQLRVKAFLLSN